jgi:DNA-binding protein YbaB
MQAEMKTLQAKLAEREMDVASAGGRIKIRINGKQEILAFEISKEIKTVEEKIKEIRDKAEKDASKAIDKRFNDINSASDKWLSTKAALAKTQHPEFTLEDLAKTNKSKEFDKDHLIKYIETKSNTVEPEDRFFRPKRRR